MDIYHPSRKIPRSTLIVAWALTIAFHVAFVAISIGDMEITKYAGILLLTGFILYVILFLNSARDMHTSFLPLYNNPLPTTSPQLAPVQSHGRVCFAFALLALLDAFILFIRVLLVFSLASTTIHTTRSTFNALVLLACFLPLFLSLVGSIPVHVFFSAALKRHQLNSGCRAAREKNENAQANTIMTIPAVAKKKYISEETTDFASNFPKLFNHVQNNFINPSNTTSFTPQPFPLAQYTIFNPTIRTPPPHIPKTLHILVFLTLATRGIGLSCASIGVAPYRGSMSFPLSALIALPFRILIETLLAGVLLPLTLAIYIFINHQHLPIDANRSIVISTLGSQRTAYFLVAIAILRLIYDVIRIVWYDPMFLFTGTDFVNTVEWSAIKLGFGVNWKKYHYNMVRNSTRRFMEKLATPVKTENIITPTLAMNNNNYNISATLEEYVLPGVYTTSSGVSSVYIDEEWLYNHLDQGIDLYLAILKEEKKDD